jgi:hypothetical protein
MLTAEIGELQANIDARNGSDGLGAAAAAAETALAA